MKRFSTFTLVFTLVAISLAIFGYKTTALEFPTTPNKQYDSWYVELRMRFQPDYSLKSDLEEPTDKPVRLELRAEPFGVGAGVSWRGKLRRPRR
jgi:hypothetical protein